MRLTLRGWTVVVAVGVAVVLSREFGPRALNAIVVPLVVVLLAGLVTTARTDRPRVIRQPVAEGFIGEQRRVEVAIETESPVAATVRDTVGDGLSATAEPVAETTLDGDETVTYDVRLEARGRRRVGPLSIAVSDIVGLVERRFEYEETTPVLVYPRVHDLSSGPAADLRALAGVADRHERDEFDHLREYHRGDPFRDIHWKAAAKRPDDELVITEYADDEAVSAVTVAAECRPRRAGDSVDHDGDGERTGRNDEPTGYDDEMAAAAASVATALLERGVPVELAVPDGTQPPGDGRGHHRELLGLLAVAGPGELDDRTRRDADVLVRTDADGTTIVVDGREIPFDRLRGRGRGEREGSVTTDYDEQRDQTGHDGGDDRTDHGGRRDRNDGGREVRP
ncbi:DUF58 domain-containing protein [Natrinema zhouii]|uniref:DUF58 domain-containing protein n=1 Tax=Natrinema zhouii TaxID=1710539 RepID=A0A7D6GYJ0_9EURY|nr:DUF58 domain-containing protein [Natrinema zhouii]QLK27846.1 DUF58 domain-containing protein [Natrinema zhouii]